MEVEYGTYQKLKPTAINILYTLYKEKLPYYEETNKCGDIIRVLYDLNKQDDRK